jgi:hypothetical protein
MILSQDAKRSCRKMRGNTDGIRGDRLTGETADAETAVARPQPLEPGFDLAAGTCDGNLQTGWYSQKRDATEGEQ